MFSWGADRARKNYEKHGVTFEEAATAFGDSDALEAEDMRIQTCRSGAGSVWRSPSGIDFCW
jgi:uncharacterized DUF497 family protein